MADEHLTITLKSPKSDAPLSRKKKGSTKRVVTLLVLLAVFAIIGLTGFVLFTKFSGPQEKLSSQNGVQANTQTASQGDDTKQLIDRVGTLMLLPDENPTVAVVSDLGKLKGQRFFANAKEGDVVLMYAHAQKAILYSPTLNKIIEVAPITNDTQQ